MSSCTVMALETTEMLKNDKLRFFEILKDHSDPFQKLGPFLLVSFVMSSEPQLGHEAQMGDAECLKVISTLVPEPKP